MTRPCVLVFAGNDPSGGAGIAADVQSVSAIGAHALPVVTALTMQDNDRVHALHVVPAPWVQQQAQVLIDKIEIAAVKIGVVGSLANAQAIASLLVSLRQRIPTLPVVLDPVLASGHGDALAKDDALTNLQSLLPLVTLITPNLPEAAALCAGDRRASYQIDTLLEYGCAHVLLKGGHGVDAEVVNRWATAGAARSWRWPRLPGAFHGSGCTLA
ncbi:MAG: hydroxymethylpyrimidine/phosphomethylpyrimidine kinase, partial [Pseudomonadota bacterium]|nr:hydroxymethylpyrimidine/phosphomethylpyrimidine kinase [Pseudomonadota bacterium]